MTKSRQELNHFKLFSSKSNVFFHKFPLQTNQKKITNTIKPLKSKKRLIILRSQLFPTKQEHLKKKKSDEATPDTKFHTLTNTYNS